MASAIPLLLVNHLGIMALIGITEHAIVMPTGTPQARYSCHNSDTREVKKKPIPRDNPDIVTSRRGLNRLLSLPLTREKIPPISTAIEKTLERSPLFQPNSSIRGFINTPKPNSVIAFMDITKKLAMTIIHP
jgi:hypothetical protein